MLQTNSEILNAKLQELAKVCKETYELLLSDEVAQDIHEFDDVKEELEDEIGTLMCHLYEGEEEIE